MTAARRARWRGYTLVALIVVVAVMNVLVAAALPAWSQMMRRDREAELIFRGLQYAEAIRVFQLRHGRFPTRLEELLEVQPRSIRRLWKDPMTDDGEWGLVFAQAAPQEGRPGGRRGRRGAAGVAPQAGVTQPGQPGGDSSGRDLAGATGPGGRQPGGRRTTGPIIGVHSLSQEEGVREFMGGTQYKSWLFTVDLIPVATTVPGTLNLPRPTSDWVGRPFREGLEPRQGTAPGQGPQTGSEGRRRPRRPRPRG